MMAHVGVNGPEKSITIPRSAHETAPKGKWRLGVAAKKGLTPVVVLADEAPPSIWAEGNCSEWCVCLRRTVYPVSVEEWHCVGVLRAVWRRKRNGRIAMSIETGTGGG